MSIKATDAPTLKRQFPHVDGISDWRAQHSVRLLWDRVFDLESRLQGALSTIDTLLGSANEQAEQLEQIDRKADEALAVAQATRDEKSQAGVPTDDGGLGAAGCAAAGATGDITGTYDKTVETAGKIICGTGAEYPALLVATATRAAQEANRSQLLDRMIWHLNAAGFPAARYSTPGGLYYHLLFDALALDGSAPVRQYAYRVLSYMPDPAAAWDPALVVTTCMVYGGQSPGLTTTPDAGIAD